MQRNMLIAVGSGGVSALASLAFLGGVPGGFLLVYVASLPLFLIGLSGGPLLAGVASFSGIVVSGILGGLLTAVIFAVAHGFPAWLVNRQALLRSVVDEDGTTVGLSTEGTGDWYPLGNIAATLFLFGAAMMIVSGHTLSSSVDGGLGDLVREHLTVTMQVMAPNVDDSLRTLMVETLHPLFPGAMAASWIGMIAINGLIAQAILRRGGHNRRPETGYRSFELPNWAAWPLIAAAAVALVSDGDVSYYARNAAIVLATPYFLLGVIVVHGVTRRLPFRPVALFAFYAVLLISTWALVIVAALGMLEQWAELRLRFAAADDEKS
ncbi:MAG: DUF2232 domain-containing protein [Rhodospirillales bacterium]